MTKQKQVFRKCYNYISVQSLYSVLCWSTFGSDYSLESSWVWRYKLGTPEFGEFLPFFSVDPLKLCQVLHSYFQVFLEMFHRVQVRALAGPLKDILPFNNYGGHCVLGDLWCCRQFFRPVPQICASTQSCLRALGTIPSTSWLGFCSLNHVKSI